MYTETNTRFNIFNIKISLNIEKIEYRTEGKDGEDSRDQTSKPLSF